MRKPPYELREVLAQDVKRADEDLVTCIDAAGKGSARNVEVDHGFHFRELIRSVAAGARNLEIAISAKSLAMAE